MHERYYKSLLRIALFLTLLWVLWTIYDSDLRHSSPEAQSMAAAARQLEDGNYQEALNIYQQTYARDESNANAVRGMAQSLMQLGMKAERESDGKELKSAPNSDLNDYFPRALSWYDQAIANHNPNSDKGNALTLAVTHANRGILRDHMGDNKGALQDYSQALQLAPELAEGPGWLTRFLRNQSERPPDIAQRAAYLRAQLAMPEEDRLLRQPRADSRQRSYTID